MLNAPWIGKAAAILILVAIFALFWLSHWLDKRGVLKNYSRGLGRGLLAVDAMLRPSKQHVQQVKEQKKQVQEHQGDDRVPRPR